jgi:hypothetical protein
MLVKDLIAMLEQQDQDMEIMVGHFSGDSFQMELAKEIVGFRNTNVASCTLYDCDVQVDFNPNEVALGDERNVLVLI